MQLYTAFAFVLMAVVVVKDAESRTSSRNRHRTRQDHDVGGSNTHTSHQWGSDGEPSRNPGQKRQIGDGDFGGTDFNQNQPQGGDFFGLGNNNQPFGRPSDNNFGNGNVFRPPNRPIGGDEELGGDNFSPLRPNRRRTTTSTTTTTPAPAPCNCVPSTQYNPVCGTNSQTYNNKQALDCARICNRAPGVQLAYEAACVDRPRT